jgi:hypothetical protein
MDAPLRRSVNDTLPGGDMSDAPVHLRRAALERERLRVQAEIVSYPMPIPACDVYFNGLLEQRARICEQLAALGRHERNSAP